MEPLDDTSRPPYVPALDGVRAVAVGLVFLVHLDGPHGVSGVIGLDLFFVLSGFLITRILVADFARRGTISLGRFYTRRLLRLYPALLIAVVALAPFARTVSPAHTVGSYLRVSVASLAYIANFVTARHPGSLGAFTPMWSLAVEEQFYLFWAVVLAAVLWLRRGRLGVARVVAVALALACAVLQATVSHHAPGGQSPPAFVLPWTRGSALFLGCSLALFDATRLVRRLGARTVALASAAGLAGVFWLFPQRFSAASMYRVFIPAADLLAALLVTSLASGAAGPVGRALEIRWVRYVGRISYPMYLWHVPLWLVMDHYLVLPSAAMTPAKIAAAVAVASASYRFVEKPILERRSRVGAWRRPSVGPAAGLTPQPAL